MHEKILETFDKRDRKLLYELDKDCGQSDAELGRELYVSKQTIRYRINRLLEQKWITRFASVIDTYRLGYYKFKLYLSFEGADKEKIREIIDFLIQHKKTEWVATCSGRWDCIAGYLVKNPYKFNKAEKELEEKYSEYIDRRELSIALGVPHWNKEYLTDKEPPYKYKHQGKTHNDYYLDEEDEEIIKLAVNNARMSVVDMAQQLNLSTRIVNYRLKKLRKEGIILSQKIFLNLPKLNFIFCKALIKFQNLNEEKYNKFFAACSDNPYLTYLINSIGSWDVELDFEVPDFNTFHKIMLSLRDKFADIIADYDFAIILEEDKLDYYPGCYPKIK